MSMQLVSEHLLKREIGRYEKSPELIKENEMFYYLCKKELAIIEKLKIENADMRGTIEESDERIRSMSIYFMNPHEYESMAEKAEKYDLISNVVNEKCKKLGD